MSIQTLRLHHDNLEIYVFRVTSAPLTPPHLKYDMSQSPQSPNVHTPSQFLAIKKPNKLPLQPSHPTKSPCLSTWRTTTHCFLRHYQAALRLDLHSQSPHHSFAVSSCNSKPDTTRTNSPQIRNYAPKPSLQGSTLPTKRSQIRCSVHSTYWLSSTALMC